jgi:beta-fructofuranosidase
MIKNGEKTIELRLYDEKRRKIKVGDTILFKSGVGQLTATVKALHIFRSFEELYAALPLDKCGYAADETATASPDDMLEYYNKEQIEKYGVVGIEIEVKNEKNIAEEISSLHYRPAKGWINDPNGLVWFNGYYHIFYQHSPNYETPWHESMHWGHARTKDFIRFEELPVALFPDKPYDIDGCWSGTAIVRDDTLYLFYACVRGETQAVAVAQSKDGIHFEKYSGNPVIETFPPEGSSDFRDPAVCFADGKFWCVMASGNREKHTAVLLLYESDDLFNWRYHGVLREWENARFAECPSFMPFEDKYLLSASVCRENGHSFSIAVGSFKNGSFVTEVTGEVDKGPDQYADQIFRDPKGRCILISWIPGWAYAGYREQDIGCMSVPREITLNDGKICAYPIEELRQFIKTSDPALIQTENGFRTRRNGRADVICQSQLKQLSCIRDGDFIEVFVNGGEEVFTALL